MNRKTNDRHAGRGRWPIQPTDSFRSRFVMKLGLVGSLCAVLCSHHHDLSTATAADNDPSRPAMTRNPELWQGKDIIQRRGIVMERGDTGDRISESWWELGPAAVGNVVSVSPDLTAEVRFVNRTGWNQRELEYTSVTKRRQYRGTQMIWTERGVQVQPGDHGRIIAEEGESVTVRFPLNCLALCPLTVGSRVIRGPDWNKGSVDGGRQRSGDADASAECWGRVTKDVDADCYITVEWNETGLSGKYRFDWRRYYDVVKAPE